MGSGPSGKEEVIPDSRLVSVAHHYVVRSITVDRRPREDQVRKWAFSSLSLFISLFSLWTFSLDLVVCCLSCTGPTRVSQALFSNELSDGRKGGRDEDVSLWLVGVWYLHYGGNYYYYLLLLLLYTTDTVYYEYLSGFSSSMLHVYGVLP